MRKLLLLVAMVPNLLWAQDVLRLSVNDARSLALSNSADAKNADEDLRAAKIQIRQITAQGLPQVNAKAGYQNFIKQPVQVIPAEFFGGEQGEFAEVVFGTKQSMSADVTASQLLFDGGYIVGLKAASAYYDLAENIHKSSINQIANTVSETYTASLLAQEQYRIQSDLSKNLDQLAIEFNELWKEGMVEEYEKDQITIQAEETRSYAKNAELQAKLSLSLLKLAIGVDQSVDLQLTDNLLAVTGEVTNLQYLDGDLEAEGTVQYELVKGQMDLQALNVKKEQAAYLPSLSMFFSHQQNAFANEFSFFDANQNWFGSTLYGVNISVPIFNSGLKHFKVQAAKVEYQKAKNNFEAAREGLKLQQATARNTYQLKFEVFQKKKELMVVVERVLETAKIKHKEGMISSAELIQAIRTYSETKGAYLGSILELVQANNAIEALTIK